MLAASRVDINLIKRAPSLSFPGITDDPEDKDNGNGEPSAEELLCSSEIASLSWWCDSVKESSEQHEEAKGETYIRSNDTTGSSEWNLINGVSVMSPSTAESDVRKNDGSPGEEGGETGKIEEPVEDDSSTSGLLDVSESTASKEQKNRWERTSRLVDKGEDLWGITFLCKSGKSSGSTINARNTNGQNGNHDHSVDEVIKSMEASVAHSNNKWRSSVGVLVFDVE